MTAKKGRIDAVCTICGTVKNIIYARYKHDKHVCSKACARIKYYRRRNPRHLESIKQCTKCKEEKHLKDFSTMSSALDKKSSECKSCTSKRRVINFDKEYNRNAKLKSQFGITALEYNNMLKNQKHRCYICSAPSALFKKKLAVDHCHVTGKVRALLCSSCNLALGSFKDNTDIMSRAIDYINMFKEEGKHACSDFRLSDVKIY